MAFVNIPCEADHNVAAVEYDEETQVLRISYQRDGRTYDFQSVDGQTARSLLTMGLTAGKWYYAVIRGRFPYTELA